MSDFFHTNPLVVRSVPRDVNQLTSTDAYDIVDHGDRHLAHAYQDLGEGGGQRFLRDLTRSVVNSTRHVVQDEWHQPMLALDEQRGKRRTTISVAWASGQHIGSITMERPWRSPRVYRLSDGHGREWGQLLSHAPRDGRGLLGLMRTLRDPLQDRYYTATDHQGQEIAHVTRTYRRDTSVEHRRYTSDYYLQLRYPQLPEPLSSLLRAATITLDFAEFRRS